MCCHQHTSNLCYFLQYICFNNVLSFLVVLHWTEAGSTNPSELLYIDLMKVSL